MKKIYTIVIVLFFALTFHSKAQTLEVSADTICAGDAIRLTATGCDGTIQWSNGKEGNSILDTLNTNQTYTAICLVNGIEQFKFDTILSISVLAKPLTPYLFCKDDEIKLGKSAEITTFGCIGTVQWSNGETGRTITVSPEKTSTYTATCVNANDCSAEPISRTIIVIDKDNPEVPDITWKYGCTGEDVTLTAAGCTAGEYVWYKNTTQLFGDAVVTTEIGRGNSVNVSEGGNQVFYTARCQFQECLGNASNRLHIDFSSNLSSPKVSTNLYLKENGSVNLNDAVTSPKTSGGVFVYKTARNMNSQTVVEPENIKIPGNYFVFELSKNGTCVSNGNRIIVEASLEQSSVVAEAEIIADKSEDLEIQAFIPNQSAVETTQSTSGGAELSSTEPNADLEDLIIPGGISPNGDGQNDIFKIQNLNNQKASFRVYNRFGHMVYEAKEYQNDWDGTANTGSAEAAHVGLPNGTYYYVLKLEDGRQKINFVSLKH